VMALAICGQQTERRWGGGLPALRGGVLSAVTGKPPPYVGWAQGRNTPFETSPSSMSSPTAWVVICSVVEFIISTTSGQDCRAVAIAEKSTGCASAMSAKMGCSGVARPCGAEQGCDQWLVVSEEAKLSPLQQESKMSDRSESGQQLPVEGRVPGARPRQLLGVERQRLPTPSVELLKHASYLCRRRLLLRIAQRSGRGAPVVPQPPGRPWSLRRRRRAALAAPKAAAGSHSSVLGAPWSASVSG
jgi:hypothetical protein